MLLAYLLKKLRKMQRRVALWILEAFYTSPILEIKAIASLVPIHLHLQKISGGYQLKISTLPNNYAIKFLFERRHTENTSLHCLLLENITPKQQLKIKDPIIDANNYLNRIFPYFNSLSYEFSSEYQLIDTFPIHFLSCYANYKNKENKAAYIYKLDECVFHVSIDSKSVVVVSDASIKKNVTMLIVYVNLHSNPIKKTIHHYVCRSRTICY